MLRLERRYVARPKAFTGNPTQAEEVAFEILDVAGVLPVGTVAAVAGQEDLVADNYGAGRTGSRQLGFPDGVLVIAPGLGQVLVRGDAEPARPPELQPVGGVDGPARKQQTGSKKGEDAGLHGYLQRRGAGDGFSWNRSALRGI